MTEHEQRNRHLHAARDPGRPAEDEPAHLTEDMWSVARTAKFLDVPKGTLYQWISHGRELRSYKVGGARKFDPVDVRAYLRKRVTEPAEQADHGDDLPAA
jgi:excisionase family DNA binding protein